MRKDLLLWILACIASSTIYYKLSTSNKETDKEYTLTYVVLYPNYRDTVTVKNSCGYYYGCDRGVNYIKGNDASYVHESSAPFKVLRYKSRIVKSKN